jgi:hypothetical protein
MPSRPSHADGSLPPELALAFAPLHKRAFGMALGVAFGLLFFGFTAIYILRGPIEGTNLWLLGQYFWGYRVNWPGALMGLVWGFVVGFVAGWFIAFCRNLILAVSIFIIRARADLNQSTDFLDHI